MKVSVLMITYNHENYIANALDSILTQNVNFDFEIVIGEDSSTDNTRNILLKYKEKNPQKIKLLLNKQNIGMSANFIQTLISCSGKYIALCDGDDYWTDPNKLQIQVDFLEANPEYSLCAHRYSIFNTFNNTYKNDYCAHLFKDNIPGLEIDIDLFFSCWLTKTLTVIFRKENFDHSIIKKYSFFRDIHLFFSLLQKGRGYCFNFNAGVYNIHGGGIHSQKSLIKKAKLNYLISKELFENNDYKSLTFKYRKSFSNYIDTLIKHTKCPFLNKSIYLLIYRLFKTTSSFKLLFSKIIKLFYYSLIKLFLPKTFCLRTLVKR